MAPKSEISFGVEFEFSVGSIKPGLKLPDPSEKRVLHFPDTAPSLVENLSPNKGWWVPVAQHMAATLTAAGHRATMAENNKHNNFETWDIGTDGSVDPPDQAVWDDETEKESNEYASYLWHPIEVRSPAFYFTPDSIRAVEDVCAILTSIYCINVNFSTGVHVHTGNGTERFEFNKIRKLAAFLFTFEPQLNSLHPQQRFDGDLYRSMRENSPLSQNFRQRMGRRIAPKEGVAVLLKCPDVNTLLAALGNSQINKGAYNFEGILKVLNGNPLAKSTIEFR
jgi:hypothetical protein